MEISTSAIYVAALLGVLILTAEKIAATRYGKPLGTALIVIILGAIFANLKIIPSASNAIPLYGHIFHYIAPISIFYLTLGVNLSKIKKAGLPMIALFIIGSLATVVGVIVAYWLVSPASVIGDSAPAIAGMITGTYTGGSLNFNAIALHYKVTESGILFAGTVAVDNVMTTIWILATLAIPKIMQPIWPSSKIGTNTSVSKDRPQAESLNLKSLMVLIPCALLAMLISESITSYWPSIPSILVITTIGLILAQTQFFHELAGSHLLGLYLVYLFLVVVGAFCEFSAISDLGEVGLVLLMFVGCVVVIHGVVVMVVGRLLFSDWEMVAIASQANIGGGTTAMALAETFGRKELIVPAILIGIIGNALGTYLGFMVAGLL